MTTGNDLLWTQDSSSLKNLELAALIDFVNQHCQQSFVIDDYQSLHDWSVESRDQFWKACWQYFSVLYEKPPTSVLEKGEQIKASEWFKGAQLNFAQNLLELKLQNPQQLALIEYHEQGKQQSLTYAELAEHVKKLAIALQNMGLEKGDRVAACVPNCAESIIAMLASTSIGAIWSSCSPDFGAKGMQDRFEQIEAKIFFTCHDYQYNGKYIDIQKNINELCQNLGTLDHLVYIESRFQEKAALTELSKNIPATITAHYFYECIGNVHSSDAFNYAMLPFSHPLYIMFSSGTTGAPKCIVHGAGGSLLQHLKEHQLHCDLKPADVLFFFTTCGWMMWNWLVSGLASKATLVLYDGSPFYPNAKQLFDIAEQEQISHFGVSAKFISAIEKQNLEPGKTHRLESLRMILSTGSPLAHESFDYVYKTIKSDVCLASISGGTDIISCFVLGNPALPVHRGEIQCKGLGMDVDIFDEQGNSLVESKGELVCKKSFPSMPVGFWNDDKGERFHKAYFQQFDNCWAHGDYAELTPHKGFIIHGRSDAVLNPGGVRIGTAEIYRQVEKVEQVLESIVVGQNHNKDVRVVLFVVLKEGLTLDEAMIKHIKEGIRSNATPRHVPQIIKQVPDIPRTKSGKIVELAVKEVINGGQVKNIEALANPEALDYFKALDLSNI